MPGQSNEYKVKSTRKKKSVARKKEKGRLFVIRSLATKLFMKPL